MSTHVWQIKRWRFSERTLKNLAEVVRFVLVEEQAGLEKALAFSGYWLESVRQRGASITVEGLWAGACRSGFRFMRGRNADNYPLVGMLGLRYLAGVVGLVADAPAYMIADKVMEDNPKL